jgi:hypothetical protein
MRRRPGAPVLLVAGLLVLAAAAVFVLPGSLVPSSARLTDAERYALENDVRTTLLQAIGGALLLMGAFLTWRQVLIGQRQLDIARQGQTTERFTRAVDQLGSDTLDVRLGGIYALESLANATDDDERGQVIEILSAFVRVHAPRYTTPDPPHAGAQAAEPFLDPVRGLRWQPMRLHAPDVQTALHVLGRLRRDGDPPVALSDTDLQRSALRRMNLAGAWISDALLRDTDVRDSDLAGARLIGSDLSGLEAAGVSFERAALQRARLRRANLSGCDLRGADLRHADLTSAVLVGADLTGANLEGTVLDRADLHDVDLTRAIGLAPGQTDGAFTDDGSLVAPETLGRARELAARTRTLALAAPHAAASIQELSRLLHGDRLAAELALVYCIGGRQALMQRRLAVRLLAQAMTETTSEPPAPPTADTPMTADEGGEVA